MESDGQVEHDDLDQCDGYVVLIADPATAQVECYGPFEDVVDAAALVVQSREDCDRWEFDEVIVELVRWHRK